MKEKVPSMLVVSSLLYKIIPINSDKGIYMIAYSDNKGADKLNREIDNKPYFETLLAKSISLHNAPRDSPDLAAVRIVNRRL